MTSPADSNWVSTRYTVASPTSSPAASMALYTSSAVMWRVLEPSRMPRIFSRGSVALRPAFLRSVLSFMAPSCVVGRPENCSCDSGTPAIPGGRAHGRERRLGIRWAQCKSDALLFHTPMHPTLPLLFLLAALLAGCNLPYKPEIQQGTLLSAEMLPNPKPGMTKREGRRRFGSPPVSDTFHPERWDYVYSVS